MLKHILNKTAGAILGAIKGVFVSAAWAYIQMGKDVLPEYFSVFSSTKAFDYLWILPFHIVVIPSFLIIATAYGVVRGLFFGAYVGFKGGILSASDKVAPIHDMYVVLKAWSAATSMFFDDVFVSRPINNYLARHYLGFSESKPTSECDLIIKDLFKNPGDKQVIKQFIESQLHWCITPEFIALKNSYFLKLVADYEYRYRADLLKILFRNGITADDILQSIPMENVRNRELIQEMYKSYERVLTRKSLMTFCLASKRPAASAGIIAGNIPRPIETDFFESLLFDKNIMKLLGNYALGETIKPSNATEIVSENSLEQDNELSSDSPFTPEFQ